MFFFPTVYLTFCCCYLTIFRHNSHRTPQSLNWVNPEVYEDAVENWEMQFPQFAEWGWGPSVHAEKWNGRHAMFGWVVICATAYAKGHGLIPNADAALNFKEWGGLAVISGKQMITNERAVILFANVHFFCVSLLAAFSPPIFFESLFLDPTHDGPAGRTEGFGFMPEMKLGLTEEAEIMNGRLAMLGLFTLLLTTGISGKPMLDIVNEWVGGQYF